MANTVNEKAEGGREQRAQGRAQPPAPRLRRPAEAQSAKPEGQTTDAGAQPERRAWARVSTLGHAGMAHGRLRPGRTAQIIDVSPGGALIETDWRLLPGTRVELQLGDPVTLHRVKGRILRCHVAMLDRERIRYRGALVFEEQLPVGSSCTTAGDFRATSQAG